MSPRLHEYGRHVEAEVVSNSKNKIHQTWGPPFRRVRLLFVFIALPCYVTESAEKAASAAQEGTPLGLLRRRRDLGH